MTTAFNFLNPTQLHFGAGRLNDLQKIAPKYGRKALLVSRPKTGSLQKTYLRIEKLLSAAGVTLFHFDEIIPNPTLEGIERGVAFAAQHQVDFILGVGGGSVMDSAKLMALVYQPSGIIDWEEAFSSYNNPFDFIPSKPSSLPFIAVSTTSGTGSQCTQAAVVSDTKNKEKITLFHFDLFPKVALVDPELMLSVPPRVTAATGFDAFTHAFESFLGTRTSPLTIHLSLEAIKTVFDFLPKALQEPENLDYRTQLAWADTCAGMCLSNGGADLPHPLGEIIGGICPRVAHGETLAMVYPSFLKYKQNSAQEKFEQIATYLGLQKQPDALRYAILELLKVTELSKAMERAQFTAQEKNEIQAHPLLEKLNPKNPKAIYSMIEESITI